MFFILSKLLLFLISPFNWFILSVAGYIFFKKASWKKRSKITAIALFIFFTNTFIFSEFCRMWEIHGTPTSKVKVYDAGIVLTGMTEYNTDLDLISIRRGGDRIWQALTLYHKGKIKKIIISGDNGYVSDRGLHEAKQMKSVLVGWGIPESDILTEEKSRNTHENALETQKLIKNSGLSKGKFLLITSGTHMRRAKACFDKIGFQVDTYTTDLYTGPERNYFWDQYLIPNLSNFENWDILMKEVVGYMMYDIVGYI